MGLNFPKARKHNCAIAKMDDVLFEQLEKESQVLDVAKNEDIKKRHMLLVWRVWCNSILKTNFHTSK